MDYNYYTEKKVSNYMSKTKISEKNFALTLGTVFSIWHLSWVTLSALSSSFKEWTFKLHFLSYPGGHSFELSIAIYGVILAFLCGAVTGWIGARVWNWLESK